MIYTLVTESGREFTFSVLSCAELFQQVYGGQIRVREPVV
jgi:hypothetical protein